MLDQMKLSNSKKNQIKKILTALVSTVESSPQNENNIGLYSGLAGELLFLFQASQLDSGLVNEELFNEKFQFLQDCLSPVIGFNLSNGLSGLGWFIEYINQAQAENYDVELCEDIDNILLETVGIKPWPGEIEMVQGISGLSVYSALRQKKCQKLNFYEKLISQYEALAIQVTEDTLTWQQPQHSLYRLNKTDPNKAEFNIGLAHGVVGIIAAILPALSYPTLYNRSKKLLKKSCDWLLQQQLEGKNKQSHFSSTSDSTHSSRLGWCYGDLTIALTLFRVGKALDIAIYQDKAIEVALHTTQRNEVTGMVHDAGLCHGSAGLAVIYQEFYHKTGVVELQISAEKWLNFTLKTYQEKGLEGFYKVSGFDQRSSECTGFLEGYAGIGLCLMACLDGEADWLDCLLLS
jgi:lantibiotic modifying enzyme